jgi:hypothetical protein
MTVAVSEILKQAAFLSVEEQQELAARLLEQARQQLDSQPSDGTPGESPASATPESSEETDDDSILDVFSLNRVPPKRTYTMKVRYKFVGRGKPMPYELDDDLLDEEASSKGEV